MKIIKLAARACELLCMGPDTILALWARARADIILNIFGPWDYDYP